MDGVNELQTKGVLLIPTCKSVSDSDDFRNRLVHGQIEIGEALTPAVLASLEGLIAKLPEPAPKSDA